jgi:serine/threonine protein kinase
VFRARFRDGRIAAVKRSTRPVGDPATFQAFKREAFFLSRLRHRNIVALLGVQLQPLALVLEYMCLGSLFDFLHQPNLPVTVGWQLRLQIALDSASGIHYMHGLMPPIIHRDFKSPNILVTRTVRQYLRLLSLFGQLTIEDHSITAKVADVGCAAALGVLSNKFRMNSSRRFPLN